MFLWMCICWQLHADTNKWNFIKIPQKVGLDLNIGADQHRDPYPGILNPSSASAMFKACNNNKKIGQTSHIKGIFKDMSV